MFLFVTFHVASLFFVFFFFFFFNDTATTEIYTLSLHDALPISPLKSVFNAAAFTTGAVVARCGFWVITSSWDPTLKPQRDRKSTRLNSSHLGISYAVFCLKKKKKTKT